MEHVALEAVDTEDLGEGVQRIALDEVLGAEEVAINRYRMPAGGDLPWGLHTHMDQEEIFYVTAGTATFETLDGPTTVAAGEFVRFAPGEFQSCTNRSGEPVTVLAIGAPPESEDTRLPATCPTCGHEDLRFGTRDGAFVFECPDCAAVHTPADCPACGGTDLRMTLDSEGSTVAACQACGATYEEPPLEQ